MTPAQFYERILAPATSTSKLANSAESHGLLLAIAGQESAWTSRIQVPGGAARSFWQIQKNGALAGVLNGTDRPILLAVCGLYNVPTDVASLFEAIAWNDTLAYTVARLALWMDPAPLPAIGDEDGAWEVYERVWRPGKPSRDRWSSVYPQAVAVINGQSAHTTPRSNS